MICETAETRVFAQTKLAVTARSLAVVSLMSVVARLRPCAFLEHESFVLNTVGLPLSSTNNGTVGAVVFTNHDEIP